MLVLRSSRAARAASPRRWATGAVLAATLLAEVPPAPDRTADRAAAGAADLQAAGDRPAAGAGDLQATSDRAAAGAADLPAAGDRPAIGAPHRCPPAPRAPLAASPDEAGAAPRPALRHLIGL